MTVNGESEQKITTNYLRASNGEGASTELESCDAVGEVLGLGGVFRRLVVDCDKEAGRIGLPGGEAEMPVIVSGVLPV